MAFNRGFGAVLVSFIILITAKLGAAKAVTKGAFAHYMVGTIYEDHAHQDIKDAFAMGLDGFALNIGDPSQAFVRQTLGYLFDYARDNYPKFKLFISIDLWAAGSAKKGLDDFDDILRDFMGHDAYYKGPNGYPFISTFSDGGLHNDVWMAWREKWANQIYFVPDFDGTDGYYLSDPGWWEYWEDVVDGIFSWESTWPVRGKSDTSAFKNDTWVREGAFSHDKSYMLGMSMLQYKNSYETNLYRAGEDNLSWRIFNLQNMAPKPEFIEIMTWNDGPESHYIGNIWPEQNNETDPTRYATQADFPHNGIRPLLSSVIDSVKEGKEIMEPPTGYDAVGALWFKPIHSSTVCPETDELYSQKPDGYGTADDVLSWAVIVSSIGGPYSIRGFSGGEELQTFYLTAGYNFGTFSALQEGEQRMELLDPNGNVIMAAAGGRCVTSTCPDNIYNLNPVILELTADVSQKTCVEPIADIYPPISTTATAGTRLFGFNKCEPAEKKAIQQAYDDYKKLTNQKGVGTGIDWNSAAALEFLGPPAENQFQRDQIQDVMYKASTIYPGFALNPWQNWIKVRCDDPRGRCPRCAPIGTLNAYALNNDPNEPKYPMVNFCPRFFTMNSLDTQVNLIGQDITRDKYDLDKYENQASTLHHELFHLDFVADSENDNPNPQVSDLVIDWVEWGGKQPLMRSAKAYGAERCKLIARLDSEKLNGYPAGHYVQRNADNLSLFALARYVQSKTGNYPYLPVITKKELISDPWDPPPRTVEYGIQDGELIIAGLGEDGDLSASDNCSDYDFEDEVEGGESLNLTALTDLSEYPAEYQTDLAAFLQSIEGLEYGEE